MDSTNADEVVIRATPGWPSINVADVWRYREIMFFLAWRDVLVRYKQTVIGVFWVVIQPLLTMVVFSVFFGKLAGVPSEGIPYSLFVYAGLLPWTYFADSLTKSSESLLYNANLIRKVYFPRLVIPISSSLSALVDFAFSFLVFLGLMVYYRFMPEVSVLLLPLLLLLTVLCSLGIGFWFGALNAMYRDIHHIIPFIARTGMFLTPVIYPASMVSGKWAWLIYINPMAGIIESFRAVLLGYKAVPIIGLSLSVLISLSLFVSGAYFFRRVEKVLPDVI
jgi:lipopolysaccharide transport system permease protein